MALSSRTKVVPLRDPTNVDRTDELAGANGAARQIDEPRRFPLVTTLPRLPVMIPDEILDYYGWVFCQGGFLNLQMTFEQFLAVVAAVSPSGLCPEYDDSSTPKLSSKRPPGWCKLAAVSLAGNLENAEPVQGLGAGFNRLFRTQTFSNGLTSVSDLRPLSSAI